MKLTIESWVDEKGYGINIQKLFQESIICYKNNAYRASFLFSYLGMLTILKETIIKTSRPSSIPEGRWDKILSDLTKDEKWEVVVYEEIVNSSNPIFNMAEDLRLQVKYWKDRRNDCAHFKRNEIAAHHTEGLWSFLRSNISKMTIEGGMESLLNKFDKHFDETYTPPNTSADHLINEISESVTGQDKIIFFERLKSMIDGRRWWIVDSDAMKVFNRILEIGGNENQEDLINYLLEDNRDINFLHSFPEKLTFFNYSKEDIRALWKNRIFNINNNINPFTIYTSLLKEKLIPANQISDANQEFLDRYDQVDYRKLPREQDQDTLKANHFFDHIIKVSIIEKDLSDFMWVNKKCDLIALAIEKSPLGASTVNCLCNMVKRTKHSWWLKDRIVGIMDESSEFKNSFKEIASQNAISLPSVFS